MFQWKDSFCLSPSNSLKQSNDFELFVSENVAVPPGKKKIKNQPINLEMDNTFISFFLLMKMKRQNAAQQSLDNTENVYWNDMWNEAITPSHRCTLLSHAAVVTHPRLHLCVITINKENKTVCVRLFLHPSLHVLFEWL